MRQSVIDLSSQPLHNFARLGQVVTGCYDTNPSAKTKELDSTDPTYPTATKVFHDGTFVFARVLQFNATTDPNYRRFLWGRNVRISAWVKTPLSYITVVRRQAAPFLTFLTINQPVTPNVWSLVSLDRFFDDGTDICHIDIGYEAAANGGVPFNFSVHRAMATVGSTHPYADGNTPGWRWVGTPGVSPSVGYPYTLESIAGKPAYFAENVPASGTYVHTLTPGGPYTIAACQQVPGTSTSPGLWLIAENGTNQARRLLAVNGPGPIFRLDSYRADGSLQANTTVPDPTVKHTSVTRVRPSGQVMDIFVNGNLSSPSFTTTASPFRPMTTPLVRIAVGARDGGPQADAPTTYGIAAWEKELDDETAKRVTAWFARRYGTPIPAGY